MDQRGGTATQGVTLSLLTNTATDGWGSADTLIGIENVNGSSLADSITAMRTTTF